MHIFQTIFLFCQTASRFAFDLEGSNILSKNIKDIKDSALYTHIHLCYTTKCVTTKSSSCISLFCYSSEISSSNFFAHSKSVAFSCLKRKRKKTRHADFYFQTSLVEKSSAVLFLYILDGLSHFLHSARVWPFDKKTLCSTKKRLSLLGIKNT